MIEFIATYLILPIVVGATVGSMYFLVSHIASYKSKIVLSFMVITAWMIGYSLGLPLSESSMALFVSLISSAIGVAVLDSTVSTIKDGKDVPPFLKWITEVVKSFRGGKH